MIGRFATLTMAIISMRSPLTVYAVKPIPSLIRPFEALTAFRGFGGPQGMFPIEYIMDDIGYALDIDPLIIRQRNFYTAMSEQAGIDFSAENIDEIAPRSKTPYGTYVKDNILPDLVSKLAEHCD